MTAPRVPVRRHTDRATPLALRVTCCDCGGKFTLHGEHAWLALRARTEGLAATCGCRLTAPSKEDRHGVKAVAIKRMEGTAHATSAR